MTEFGSQSRHDRYQELCALATAGVLTPAESESLADHLKTCAGCRETLAQYWNIATDGMSFLADSLTAASSADAFNEASGLTRLLSAAAHSEPQTAPLVIKAAKSHAWKRALVAGLVAASLAAAFYVGAYRGSGRPANPTPAGMSAQSLDVADRLIAEKQALEKVIEADRQRIEVLEQQTLTDKAESARLRTESETAARRLASMTDAMNAARRESDAQQSGLIRERDQNADRWRDAETRYRSVQDELNTLRSQRQQILVRLDELNTLRNQHERDLQQMASLETRVDRLTAELNDQGKRAKTDEQYLVSDKDVRDLIGARNLYIADIMDVSATGQSRKPFGRVFYTKTKSLVFYAYDLDGQPGVRRTSTFQVWGRTSGNDRKPINLGILYMDSETNRRWTLHVDNPEQLAMLDAIFVTIEPREQTDKPTGKPFLYASLRREPNHP